VLPLLPWGGVVALVGAWVLWPAIDDTAKPNFLGGVDAPVKEEEAI
jgi:hypothetical protein